MSGEVLEAAMSRTGQVQAMFPYEEGMVCVDVTYSTTHEDDYAVSITLHPNSSQQRMVVKVYISPSLAQVSSFIDGVLTMLRREVPRFPAGNYYS